jgi:hypothetical protein
MLNWISWTYKSWLLASHVDLALSTSNKNTDTVNICQQYAVHINLCTNILRPTKDIATHSVCSETFRYAVVPKCTIVKMTRHLHTSQKDGECVYMFWNERFDIWNTALASVFHTCWKASEIYYTSWRSLTKGTNTEVIFRTKKWPNICGKHPGKFEQALCVGWHLNCDGTGHHVFTAVLQEHAANSAQCVTNRWWPEREWLAIPHSLLFRPCSKDETEAQHKAI